MIYMPLDSIPFSLIIPARNSEKTLEICLQSVLQSNLLPEEIIVVVDTSTDRTLEIAQSYSCQTIEVSTASGPMAPRFAGAKTARNPFFVFLDSDVVVEPDTFTKLMSHFHDPQTHAVSGILNASTRTGTFFGDYKNEYMNFIFSKQQKHSDFIYGSLWAIRKTSLIEFNPITKPFGSLVSDSEMGFQLTHAGKKIILDRHIQVKHIKPYTFTGILKNDFVIPFCFAQILIRYRAKNTAQNKRFSHVSLWQTIFSGVAFLALFSLTLGGLFQASLLMLVFFAYWSKFSMQLYRSRGLGFTLGAILFTPIDAAIMFCGAASGFSYALLNPAEELKT